ncbi:MAG: response regulator transcription factor [bacterium]
MKILIAEDDAVSRLLLETTLRKWNYDVLVTEDGVRAWEELQKDHAPSLAIIDWMMPGLDGLEVCRRVRSLHATLPIYIIFLTARGSKNDILAGFEAGANDYLTKPFDREELRARVQAGVRIVELESDLADRIKKLEDALSQVRQLEGMLPICAYCNKIRSDGDYWHQVEEYIMDHTDAVFSHSVCPACEEKYLKPELEKFMQSQLESEKQES